MTAVAVAVRGPGSNSDSSPNISPGPRIDEQVLPAVAGGAAELDLAFGDHVQPVAGVALVEEDLAPPQAHLRHRPPQREGGVFVERREQRRLVDDDVVHVESSSGHTRVTGRAGCRRYSGAAQLYRQRSAVSHTWVPVRQRWVFDRRFEAPGQRSRRRPDVP